MLEEWLARSAYRSGQMKDVAKQLALSYERNDDFGLINFLKDFKLFNRGRQKEILNIIGEKSDLFEVDYRVFDYKYVITAGKHSKTFRQTVFFVQSKHLGLPQFYMHPERFFDKAGTYLGIDDIDFEAFPKFSDQYWLKGEEEGLIRNAMSNKILHFFTVEKEWSLEAINYFLIFYKKNELIPSENVASFYEKGKHIVDMFSKA